MQGRIIIEMFSSFGGYINYIPIISTGELEDIKSSLPIVIKQGKVQRGYAEGYECTDCKDFCPMVELNQPDNATEFVSFKCYSCRNGLRIYF